MLCKLANDHSILAAVLIVPDRWHHHCQKFICEALIKWLWVGIFHSFKERTWLSAIVMWPMASFSILKEKIPFCEVMCKN
jgi:hypothetical protein